MKICISAWSVQQKLFSGDMVLYDFIRLCHKNGVKYVELLDCFWNDRNKIEDIKELLNELNMEVGAYSIGNDFVQNDINLRNEQINSVKSGIDTACKLNTNLLRIFSGNTKDGVSFDTARGWIINSLKEASGYAEEMGITMVLENHGLFAGRSSQVKELIEEVGSNYLKANTDIGNFMLVNENPLEAVKALKEYVGFVHFKDFKTASFDEEGYAAVNGTKYQGTVLGKGEVPMKEIVEFLHNIGYKGFLSIEYEGTGDQIKETLESLQYTKLIIQNSK